MLQRVTRACSSNVCRTFTSGDFHANAFTFLSTLMLSACLSAKPIDQGNDTSDDTSSNGASATVADIQQGVIGDGEDVYLERVVVTSGIWRRFLRSRSMEQDLRIPNHGWRFLNRR